MRLLQTFSVAIFIFLLVNKAISQNNWNEASINNFGTENHGGSFSNWRVLQSQQKSIFIGNLEGILKYNGRWAHFNDGISSAFSLDTFSGSILIGSPGDIGYLTASRNGSLKYISIKDQIVSSSRSDSAFINFDSEIIWSITTTSKGLSFYTKKAIYNWDGGNVHTLSDTLNPFQSKLITLGDKVYCLQSKIGLVEINNGKADVIFNDTNLGRLIFMDSLKNETLIVTTEKGALIYDGVNMRSANTGTENILRDKKVFSFIKLSSGPSKSYALSTINSGIYILNDKFQIIETINTGNGLKSNVIKQIAEDDQQNIWVASIGSLSMIEVASPWKWYSEKTGLQGAIRSIVNFDGKTYVGSSEGLFQIEHEHVKKISNQKIWGLQSKLNHKNEEVLLILSQQGLFEYNGKVNIKIGEGGSMLFRLNNGTYLHHSQNEGIVRLKQLSNGEYKSSIFFQEKDMFVSGILETANDIWIASKTVGVYQFNKKLESNLGPVLHDYLKGANEIKITKIGKEVFASTKRHLYQYINSKNKFVPIEGFDLTYTEVATSENNNLLLGIRNGNTFSMEEISYDSAESQYKYIGRRFARPKFGEIINFKDTDSVIWVMASNGLFRYDKSSIKNIDFEFNSIVNQVEVNDSTIFHGNYSDQKAGQMFPSLTLEQPDEFKFTFDPEQNNFTFHFTCTSFEAYDRNQYSYYLKNNDQTWSKWSTETKKEYTNLAAGDYTFMVKSKNIYDTIGRTATYEFTILPPWYQTSWAYIGFALLSILFIWFISLAYTYRVRMQRRKLKLIVADRTFEVISQKKEIEKQNQLLKTQYGEISCQKDEIEMKNSELQQSQEEILTINEKLKELNSHLENKVEQRTQKIKTTLLKLKKTNKELDTFVYRASHDLKGPISRIHGLTSLAKLEDKGASNTKYYDLIEHAALDMQGLLSKLSHAYEIMNKEVVLETIDIPFLLSEIRNAVKFLDHGTKYSFDIQEKLSLHTDKYLLKIILENVIENALIFRKKDVDHEINIKCYEENGNFYFQIADNGIGIAEEHLNKIYEMFFRGSDQSKGSGLGLYITRLALEKISGEIEASSTVYEYSHFTIRIPLVIKEN